MKRLKQHVYSDPIPVDILIDIFSLVPGESIARFRCVSKLWRYILGRPDFKDLFLTKSSTRPRFFFSLHHDGKVFFYSTPQLLNQGENSTLVATRYHTSYPKYFPDPSKLRTLVCGLALFKSYERKIRVIFNPITGEFLTLPKLLLKNKNLPDMKAKSTIPDREIVAGIYLGYDPISKQFKVLCMTSSHCERPNTHQVLTLESGKRLWRRLESKFHFIENHRMANEICINGVLYFGGVLRQSSVIVCFDVRSEKFSFINMKRGMFDKYDIESYSCWYLTLFNYKGKLGIRQATKEPWEYHQLVLWVVEDSGSHKWSKQVYELPRLVYNSAFVFAGMAGTGEIVFSVRSPFCVYLYNLEGETFTRVHIQGFERFNTYIRTFVVYVENMEFM